MINLILVLWIIYCWYEGRREGIYWNLAKDFTTPDGDKYKEHLIWTIQRIIVVIGFSLVNMMYVLYCSGGPDHYYYSLIVLGGSMGSLWMMLPFIHDGVYYITREKLYPGTYPKKFFSTSTTSNAINTYTFKIRILLFLLGLIIYCLQYLFI